jgi:hypothetical protein
MLSPKVCLNLVGTNSRVGCIGEGENLGTLCRWPRNASPDGSFVIKVPQQKTIFLVVGDQFDDWNGALQACARARLPSRKTLASAPEGDFDRVGFGATVASGREITGGHVLYKVYIHHATDSQYNRITCFVEYDDLVALHSELQTNLPSSIALPTIPTSRVSASEEERSGGGERKISCRTLASGRTDARFSRSCPFCNKRRPYLLQAFRSKEQGALQERVDQLHTYLDSLLSLGGMVVSQTSARKVQPIKF